MLKFILEFNLPFLRNFEHALFQIVRQLIAKNDKTYARSS